VIASSINDREKPIFDIQKKLKLNFIRTISE